MKALSLAGVATVFFLLLSMPAHSGSASQNALKTGQQKSCAKQSAQLDMRAVKSIEEIETKLGVNLEEVDGLMGLDIDTCPECYIVFGNTIYRILNCYCA